MSIQRRTERLQRFLNEKFDANIAADGAFGSQTLGALERAFEIEAWAAPKPARRQYAFDARSEKNLASLDAAAVTTMRELVSIARAVGKKHGVTVKVISGHRSWDEQDRLYAQGRTAPGKIVTKARGGYSNHNFGIAIDLGLFKGRTYLDGSKNKADRKLAAKVHREIGAAVKAEGLPTVWGGDWTGFSDAPHHEIDTGLSMSKKRLAYLDSGSVMRVA